MSSLSVPRPVARSWALLASTAVRQLRATLGPGLDRQVVGLRLTRAAFLRGSATVVEHDDQEDREVIARLAGGDRHALNILYSRYAPLLLGLGIKMLRSREDAEDIVHDVFMEAWAKAKTYDAERGTVRGWLTLRMRSRVVDKIRSAPRRREIATDQIPEPQGPGKLAPDAEPKLMTERKRIIEALTALTDDQRRAVELVYLEARSVAEAAVALACPEGTVKSRLFAARRALRASLPSEGT